MIRDLLVFVFSINYFIFCASKKVLYLSSINFYVLCLEDTLYLLPVNCKDKGKAIPLQAWRDPKGSRRMRLPDFKTVGT